MNYFSPSPSKFNSHFSHIISPYSNIVDSSKTLYNASKEDNNTDQMKRKLIIHSNDYSINKYQQTLLNFSRQEWTIKEIIDGSKIAVDIDYVKSLKIIKNNGKMVLNYQKMNWVIFIII